MTKIALAWLRRSLLGVAAAALSAGCAAEAPSGPNSEPAFPAQLAAAPATRASVTNVHRGADLTGCEKLQAPAGSKLAVRLYANGVQIYRWNGTTWSFVAPSAVLTADAGGRSTIGTHYAGPTWESMSGGKVAGAVLERCTPDANAIPWLLLAATPDDGPGIFHRVSFIQRVNTVGGNAPAAPGTFLGQEARVPYTTEYLFYRAQ